jgi:RNA polymerase sigma factor
MKNLQIEQIVRSAKNGNELARQQIIDYSKPFIINVVSHICKRFISWSDEESSIGLLAFNRAIDTFESSKGRSFLSYSYCLINRDMVNYFRKNKYDSRNLSLDCVFNEEEASLTDEEINKSIQIYQEKLETAELVEEILELDQKLNEHGIKFEEIESASPKHRDTRDLIYGMVRDFINDAELVDELIKKKRLPATSFAKKTVCSLKTIEKHRKYLITMIIIGLHPEWMHLSSFVKIK